MSIFLIAVGASSARDANLQISLKLEFCGTVNRGRGPLPQWVEVTP